MENIQFQNFTRSFMKLFVFFIIVQITISCSPNENEIKAQIANDKATMEALATKIMKSGEQSSGVTESSNLLPTATDVPSGVFSTTTLQKNVEPTAESTPIPTEIPFPTATSIPTAPPATIIPWPTDIPIEEIKNVPRLPGSALVYAEDDIQCASINAVRVYYLPGPGDINVISQWYADALPGYGWLYDEIRTSDSGNAIYQEWDEDTNSPIKYRLIIRIYNEPQEEIFISGCPGSDTLPKGRPTDMQITIILSH